MKKLALICWILIFQSVQVKGHNLFFRTREVSRVSIGKLYRYHFEAKDSLERQINYLVKEIPSWLHYNKIQGSIYGRAKKAGQYRVHLLACTVSDTTEQIFMVTVFDKQTSNILCLGNSLTNGVDHFNSYRRYLWQLLHKRNYDFDFIGSWSKHHMGSDVPNPDFDMDHEGHSGWRFDNLLNHPDWDSARGNINTWIKSYFPDIVLIELGTNDVFQCRKIQDMMKDLSSTVTLLRGKNRRVKIFVAQIPPLGSQWADKKLCGTQNTYSQDIIALNKSIASFASMHSTVLSPVIAVDQYKGVDCSKDMFDDIHPNEKGEKIMAQRWFDAIKTYLNKL